MTTFPSSSKFTQNSCNSVPFGNELLKDTNSYPLHLLQSQTSFFFAYTRQRGTIFAHSKTWTDMIVLDIQFKNTAFKNVNLEPLFLAAKYKLSLLHWVYHWVYVHTKCDTSFLLSKMWTSASSSTLPRTSTPWPFKNTFKNANLGHLCLAV